MSAIPVNIHVARDFVKRATAQDMKGKARDRAALEFVMGAVSLLQMQMEIAKADETSDAKALADLAMRNSNVEMLAYMVSIRGYSFIKEIAETYPVADGGK